MRQRRRKASAPREVSPWPFVGMGLMAMDFFLYAAASWYVAPWWGVLLLVLVWLVLFGLCLRWWTPHPTWLPWVGVAALALWFGALVAGGAWLGWSP